MEWWTLGLVKLLRRVVRFAVLSVIHPTPFYRMKRTMRRVLGGLILLCGGTHPEYLQSAVTLEDAASYWRFDKPSGIELGSTVQVSQIQDYAGRYTASSVSGAVKWTDVDQPSGSAFASSGTGLSFNPSVETLNAGSTNYDNIRSSLLEINHADVAARGNSTLFTRIFWEGRVAGSDDGPLGNQYWILRNGYSGAGKGFLMGLRTPSTNPDEASLQVFYVPRRQCGGQPAEEF